jgi:hypothetical protein
VVGSISIAVFIFDNPLNGNRRTDVCTHLTFLLLLSGVDFFGRRKHVDQGIGVQNDLEGCCELFHDNRSIAEVNHKDSSSHVNAGS